MFVNVAYTEETRTVQKVELDDDALKAAYGPGPYTQEQLEDFVTSATDYYDGDVSDAVEYEVRERDIESITAL